MKGWETSVSITQIADMKGWETSVCITQNLTTSMETWYVAYVIPYNYIDKVHLDLKYIQ